MADNYNVTRTNGDIIVVTGGVIGVTNPLLSVALVGEDAPLYGLQIAETQVAMLENFANTSAPVNPIIGQAWFNTSLTEFNINTGADGAGAIWTPVKLSTDPTTFLELTDTPSSYSGQDGYRVVVSGSALIFEPIPAETGQANTASNLGTGEGLATTKVLDDLPFKSIVAGANVSLVSDANEITISATGSSGTANFEVGMIMMWSGSVVSIPTLWKLCDGANGTPNLQNRFVVGAGDEYIPGATGGADTQGTSSNGAHTHNITVAGHTLSIAEIPTHTHGFGANEQTPELDPGNSFGGGGGGTKRNWLLGSTDTDGGTGGDQSHSHPGSTAISNGAHTHTIDTRSRYYALAYIMYTGV